MDAAVVGTGPAGLAAALALAMRGRSVALVGPRPVMSGEARTAALFPASVRLLERLGVWQGIASLAAPLRAIRIVDQTSHLLRAPEAFFRAEEIGLEAFGSNIANGSLVEALWAHATAPERGIAVHASALERLELHDENAVLHLAGGGRVAARLVAAADGAQSLCRQAADIGTRSWRYDQDAIALAFSHARPHEGVSTEIHRDCGPLTTVPMPGHRSSLVWTERPRDAERLMALDDLALARELERRLEGLLGTVGEIAARGRFAMRGLIADAFAARRVALIGEAAHAFPPIGAQGLNLGLRDVAVLAEAAGRTGDAGRQDVLERYDAARRADVRLRTTAVDGLNRSLIEGFLPFQLARGAGLHLLNAVGPLRRAIMRRGLAGTGDAPPLMR